jgi:DNA-binding transcriptional ArsR family regulator
VATAEIDTSAAARLKAASDPMRIRMGLLMLDDGRTVKELAETLDVPPTRLYYHMKILERHGLVEVVERRMVSGIEERRYRAVAAAWAFGPEMEPSTAEFAVVTRAVLGAVQGEIEVVLQDISDTDAGALDTAVPVMSMTDLLLTAEELAEVQEAINGINDRFAKDRLDTPPNARRYHFLFAGWQRPEVSSAS